jgi:thiosulfate/3-mercaptopyruvate sulfurtransferase
MNKLNKPILIVAEALQEALTSPETVVIDCRFDLGDPLAGRRAYEHGHVPGAVFLDLDKDLAGPVTEATGRHPLPDPDELSRRLGQLGIARSHEVVVYDGSHGGIAARAWWTLRWLGHERVRLLDGGLAAWLKLDLPLEAGIAAREAVDYMPDVRHELVLTTDDLCHAEEGVGSFNLFDARDAARFRGEIEPIDPVAGHIPQTSNLPFTDFVHEDGTWRPLAERASRLSRALGGEQDPEWSVMCGSGVTACHLAISGLEAGFPEPRIYIGSWSEWIRDPGRPIAGDEE